MNHEYYMAQALTLAKKGQGFTNPNPMVGAVIVKDGNIIGEGFHKQYGDFHAEINAINSCDPNNATLYVTLEPCTHYGKTPPCADAIIKSGIKQVVIGVTDPNPLVAGKGIEKLQKSGINTVQKILEEECRLLNTVFFHYMQTGMPYVVMKYAMTIDGKISTFTGASKYITDTEALHNVHKSRHIYSSIMVGVNTVIADDPLLTCRIDGLKNPVRVICDTNLRIPTTSKIVNSAQKVRTVIATACTDEKRIAALKSQNIEILQVSTKNCDLGIKLDIKDVMKKLGLLGIDSVLLEGGATLNWSALESGVVNRVQAYIAPKVFGGEKALSPIGGTGVSLTTEAIHLKSTHITKLGKDILIEGNL
ncbi:MAG: bifunctional diaminohydroxyphosphoribosylaminopyrimidine deaminase/5-amino-6-(5-phosphoribosylamino)uracil reductase RibD [Defluviitaleaceae bacterium]|nr:bifunctional diaminohydroxyphosphoribosylaminopyrimidine deaminase/5-amino-6-(5-phosphoribosylamino)uracil reductase RibD [Defluviitaleaceae bacterium]